ncbi:hypothetical protein A4A49_34568 [Nicotiana attenuata]|uniref:Uncharacterized protein n=1 Tax=Nicotiana attenuata TaxID=49451 RepID=A0A1J6KG20_NICAT|nr:hypothetical protein A4A49_34568 [Nicotiana attenuata]
MDDHNMPPDSGCGPCNYVGDHRFCKGCVLSTYFSQSELSNFQILYQHFGLKNLKTKIVEIETRLGADGVRFWIEEYLGWLSWMTGLWELVNCFSGVWSLMGNKGCDSEEEWFAPGCFVPRFFCVLGTESCGDLFLGDGSSEGGCLVEYSVPKFLWELELSVKKGEVMALLVFVEQPYACSCVDCHKLYDCFYE